MTEISQLYATSSPLRRLAGQFERSLPTDWAVDVIDFLGWAPTPRIP